jgi:hypothetical protein
MNRDLQVRPLALRVILAFAMMLLTVAANGAKAQDAELPQFSYTPRPDSEGAASSNLYPNFVAEAVGLPELADYTLPAGMRETRLLLICDLCSPLFLVVIRDGMGWIDGEVYVLGSTLTFDQGNRSADDYQRAVESTRVWRDQLARETACGPWQLSAYDPKNDAWCESSERPREEWAQLLSALGHLGMLTKGSPTGYSPGPPTAVLERAAVEAGMRGESVPYPDPGCNDIGGEALTIEVLSGPDFRQAHYWCLEAPRGDEHEAAASARDLLMTFVRPDAEAPQ